MIRRFGGYGPRPSPEASDEASGEGHLEQERERMHTKTNEQIMARLSGMITDLETDGEASLLRYILRDVENRGEGKMAFIHISAIARAVEGYQNDRIGAKP